MNTPILQMRKENGGTNGLSVLFIITQLVKGVLVSQDELKLVIFMPLPLKYWESSHVPP
jgi:hypothetical protein